MRVKVSKNVISFFRRARTQYGCIKAIEGMLLAPLDDKKDEIARKIPNRDRYAEGSDITRGDPKQQMKLVVPVHTVNEVELSPTINVIGRETNVKKPKPEQKVPFYRAFDPSFKNGRRIR